MYDHTLVTVKGPPRLNRLDFSAAPAAAQTILQGAIVSINSAGAIVEGCAVGIGANRPMPMWAIQATTDFDANSDVGNISGGVQSAVVATGGFEIETTEFVDTVYAPNDLLKPGLVASLGKFTLATVPPYGAEVIVGCVSKAVATNRDGVSVLRFWTMFLPASLPVST
jgi:hypothetical protein